MATTNDILDHFHRNMRQGLDRAVEAHMINLYQVLLVSKPGDTKALDRSKVGIKAAETAFLDLTAYLEQCYGPLLLSPTSPSS